MILGNRMCLQEERDKPETEGVGVVAGHTYKGVGQFRLRGTLLRTVGSHYKNNRYPRLWWRPVTSRRIEPDKVDHRSPDLKSPSSSL